MGPGIGTRGEQSTNAEILALTNLAALPTDATQAITKTGASTFGQSPIGAASSGITRIIQVKTSNFSAGAVAATDYVYLVSGATTCTLPTAVGNTNSYYIERTGTSTVGIASTGAEIFNASAGPLNLIVQYASVVLYSDGTNWKY